MTIIRLQRVVVDALEDIKAQDIRVYDTSSMTELFDRVVVASATSNRQTRALAGHVRDTAKSKGFDVISTEGEDTGEWVLVDLGDIVVHIMQPAIRQYYNLEELWGGKPVRMKLGGPDAPRPSTSGLKPAGSKAAASKAAAGPAGTKKPAAKKPATGASSGATASAAKPASRPPVTKALVSKAPAATAPAAKAPAARAPASKATASKTAAATAPGSKKPDAKKADAKTPASPTPAAKPKSPARKTTPSLARLRPTRTTD